MVTNDKKLAKRVLAVHLKAMAIGKKEKKGKTKRMTITKLFALRANAKTKLETQKLSPGII